MSCDLVSRPPAPPPARARFDCDRLRRFQVEHGMTQERLARRIGVTDRTLRSWLGGAINRGGFDRSRCGETLDRIAAVLGCSADELCLGPGGDGHDAPRGGEELPVYTAPWVGRAAELAALGEALGSRRLVTVVGPGGVGKTRLAVEAAGRRSPIGGVSFVALDRCEADDLALPSGCAAALLDRARPSPAVLIVDACDRVVDAAAAAIARVLQTCPRVTVLATCREALRLPGEHVVGLGSMGADAVELLRVRAAAAGVAPGEIDAAWAAKLCARVDGLPLGVEIAAAALRTLDADRVASRPWLLEQRAEPPRHRSLRACVAWSWDLLDDRARATLRRLSGLGGEWSLADLGAADDEETWTVHGLVRRSLVLARRTRAGLRYEVPWTVRDFVLAGSGAGGWPRSRDPGDPREARPLPASDVAAPPWARAAPGARGLSVLEGGAAPRALPPRAAGHLRLVPPLERPELPGSGG